MLVTKKTATKLGMSIYDANGSKVSDFAQRQMEKMGWQEGKGLGKNETGISKHIKAVKRDDNSGLGSESVQAEEVAENWWHDAFSKQLKVFQSSSSCKKSKSKKSSKKKKNDSDDLPPSYAELFAATGGARLGMRARANQKGKHLRTENAFAITTEQLECVPTTDEMHSSSEMDDGKKKKSKKSIKTIRSEGIAADEMISEKVQSLSQFDDGEKKKDKKKKKIESISAGERTPEEIPPSLSKLSHEEKKKDKKRKCESIAPEETPASEEVHSLCEPRDGEKKKDKKRKSESINAEETLSSEEVQSSSKLGDGEKKKDKKKRKSESINADEETLSLKEAT
jgi:Pin2-interacting protein X1